MERIGIVDPFFFFTSCHLPILFVPLLRENSIVLYFTRKEEPDIYLPSDLLGDSCPNRGKR